MSKRHKTFLDKDTRRLYGWKRYVGKSIFFLFEPVFAVVLVLCCTFLRFIPKKFDIGFGPLPVITAIYHKKVFTILGYSCESFVNQVWHITDGFDQRFDNMKLKKIPVLGRYLAMTYLFLWCAKRYKCLFLYFNGGPLCLGDTNFLWRLEPSLLRLAKAKTIVLPYGSDIQIMSRSPNLYFKHTVSMDYPLHRIHHNEMVQKVDMWTSQADYVVGGCEWVDYMHHWDALMIAHFTIDVEDWAPRQADSTPADEGIFKVLHAPNHRTIKGTQHIIDAVQELKHEGYPVELILLEKVPNVEVRRMIEQADIVVDQLVIGWYAMFAIEAMALEKPVICNTRSDLESLYRSAGLLETDECLPLIHATPETIKSVILDCYNKRAELNHIGKKGREYVIRHHSIDAIVEAFRPIAENIIGPAMNKNGEYHG